MLRFWLCEACVEPPSAARLTEALRQLLETRADHLPSVQWGGWALRRYRQRVFLTPARVPRIEGPYPWSRAPDAEAHLGAELGTLRWGAQVGGLDARRLPELLWVRGREGGEALKPAAHAKTQSVQHLCQSQGVLPWMRDALPLVYAQDTLIAVADLWLDARWCTGPGDPGLAVQWRNAPIVV